MKWCFPIILCSVPMFLVPFRSLFRSSCSSLCVVSFIHWLSFFGVWSVCHTDTHIYLLSLALALSIHNKQIKSFHLRLSHTYKQAMLRSAVVCGIAATASGFVLTGPAAVRPAGISASSVRSLRRNGLELRMATAGTTAAGKDMTKGHWQVRYTQQCRATQEQNTNQTLTLQRAPCFSLSKVSGAR